MSEKKTSWDYQKGKPYKQVKINFNLDDKIDAIIYHYISHVIENRTKYIKELIYKDMLWRNE